MRTLSAFLLIFTWLVPVMAQDNITGSPQRLYVHFAEAMKRSSDSDHRKALAYMDSALAIAPHYSQLRYSRARLLELSGDSILAAKELQLLIDQKQLFVKRMQGDSLFLAKKIYRPVVNNLKALDETISRSAVHIRLKEKDLLPEGITYDPLEKSFYVSSIYKRKIVKIDSLRNVTDFIPTAQEGLLSTLGMEIDPARRHLWVCSSYSPSNEIINGEGLKAQAAIFKFNLNTGELIKKYTLSDTLRHFFNDITVIKNGDVYFTDSEIGTAYFIDSADEIRPLFDEHFLLSANGITKDDQGENLFISSWVRGIIKYNLASKHWKWIINDDPSTNLSGADGLAYYNGSLIVNSPIESRGVLQMKLSPNKDRITGAEFLEYGNEFFGEPTTGEIAGDEFYYIANAGLSAYDRSTGKLDKEKLELPVILKVNLKE